jgi:hypothetical protein
MDFWEMIQKIIRGGDDDIEAEISYNDALIQYDPEMIAQYNYIITAHPDESNSKLTISFFKPEQWEMVLSTAELMGSTAEDIVRGLGSDDVHQLIIAAEDWNPDDGLEELF